MNLLSQHPKKRSLSRIAKRPVPQHLEHRVVIRIQADVIEVVVFASGANALLSVRGTGITAGNDPGPFGNVGGPFTKENWHELVHAGVGEQQVRAVRHQAGGRNDRMQFGPEEIQKALADLNGRHKNNKRSGVFSGQRRGCTQKSKGIRPGYAAEGAFPSCGNFGDRSSLQFPKNGGGPPQSKRRGVFLSAAARCRFSPSIPCGAATRRCALLRIEQTRRHSVWWLEWVVYGASTTRLCRSRQYL